jgi:hypothetical protein
MPAKSKPGSRKPTPPPTPPQARPWDIPPLPSMGDLDQDRTYVSVGHALSSWEYFEGTLGFLYGVLVGDTKETSPALRAYGAVSAFSTRRDMIFEASKAYFFANPSYIEAQIKSLIDDAKHLATRRNEIAHGIIQPCYTEDLALSGYVVGPSRYAVRKRKLTKHHETQTDLAIGLYAYNSDIVSRFSAHFSSLGKRTREICTLLSSPLP